MKKDNIDERFWVIFDLRYPQETNIYCQLKINAIYAFTELEKARNFVFNKNINFVKVQQFTWDKLYEMCMNKIDYIIIDHTGLNEKYDLRIFERNLRINHQLN